MKSTSIYYGSKVLATVEDDNSQSNRRTHKDTGQKQYAPIIWSGGIKTILNNVFTLYLLLVIQMHQDIRLSNKLLEQGYVKERLKSSLKKFNGRYGDLIKQYEHPLSRMLNDIMAYWTKNFAPIIRSGGIKQSSLFLH